MDGCIRFILRCINQNVFDNISFHVLYELNCVASLQSTLFHCADVCVLACPCVMTLGLPDQLSPFPPPPSILSPSLLCLFLLNIYSAIRNFYWPSLPDGPLYTVVSFKTSVVSQAGTSGTLDFNSPF